MLHLVCSLLLRITCCLLCDAAEQLADRLSERCAEVEEEQGVEAEVQHRQQQRPLLPQKQPPLGLTVCDDFGLGQRVRRPDNVVGHEAEYVGQSHGRHTACYPSGFEPEFRVTAAAQQPPDSQTAGQQHAGRGVHKQSCAEEDGEGVPLEADVFLQRRTAEVLFHLQRQTQRRSNIDRQSES